jgi:hypothetical protein
MAADQSDLLGRQAHAADNASEYRDLDFVCVGLVRRIGQRGLEIHFSL